MSRLNDLIEGEVRAAKNDRSAVDTELPETVRVSRGHDRSRVLQVRLNEDEYRLLVKLADEEMIPTSTFARAILLKTIGL